jgi:amino acid transporter
VLGSTFILNIVQLLHPDYKQAAWHQFLIYVAFALIALAVNSFSARLLPLLNKAAFIWSLSGFVIISITVLACSSPTFQSGEFVYGKFINEVGWPDGLAWLLGLLQGAFALTGFDAVAHMIEEVRYPGDFILYST